MKRLLLLLTGVLFLILSVPVTTWASSITIDNIESGIKFWSITNQAGRGFNPIVDEYKQEHTNVLGEYYHDEYRTVGINSSVTMTDNGFSVDTSLFAYEPAIGQAYDYLEYHVDKDFAIVRAEAWFKMDFTVTELTVFNLQGVTENIHEDHDIARVSLTGDDRGFGFAGYGFQPFVINGLLTPGVYHFFVYAQPYGSETHSGRGKIETSLSLTEPVPVPVPELNTMLLFSTGLGVFWGLKGKNNFC